MEIIDKIKMNLPLAINRFQITILGPNKEQGNPISAM